jgi:hypothetical protein
VNRWQRSVRWPDADSPRYQLVNVLPSMGRGIGFSSGHRAARKVQYGIISGCFELAQSAPLPARAQPCRCSQFPWCRIIFLVLAHCFLTFLVAAFLIIVFNTGFCSPAATGMSLASWAANRALNLLRASSVEFNVCFFLCHSMRPGSV